MAFPAISTGIPSAEIAYSVSHRSRISSAAGGGTLEPNEEARETGCEVYPFVRRAEGGDVGLAEELGSCRLRGFSGDVDEEGPVGEATGTSCCLMIALRAMEAVLGTDQLRTGVHLLSPAR
jgi:hypothetical protein